MALVTRTFKISRGEGVRDVDVFLQNELGRNVSLIESMTAVSLNKQTTQLTITYRTAPEKVVDISNPIPGLIVSTGNVPSGIVVQFASEVRPETVTGGSQIQFNGSGVTGQDYDVIAAGSNYILNVQVQDYYSTGATGISGIQNLLIDESIKDSDGFSQQNSALVGFTITNTASPYPGKRRRLHQA